LRKSLNKRLVLIPLAVVIKDHALLVARQNKKKDQNLNHPLQVDKKNKKLIPKAALHSPK